MKSDKPWYNNVLGVGDKLLVVEEGACEGGFCEKSVQLHSWATAGHSWAH